MKKFRNFVIVQAQNTVPNLQYTPDMPMPMISLKSVNSLSSEETQLLQI